MIARFATVAAVVLCVAACSRGDPIAVTDAWVRMPAPGMGVAAGYFNITNRGPAPVDLVDAHTDAAESVQIHAESHNGDMMQMRRLSTVTLPPGESVSFAPGGTHLMLLGFAAVTSPEIPITLRFSDGSQRVVEFETRALSGAPK